MPPEAELVRPSPIIVVVRPERPQGVVVEHDQVSLAVRALIDEPRARPAAGARMSTSDLDPCFRSKNQSGPFFYVALRQSCNPTLHKLIACKEQALLTRKQILFVVYLGFEGVDGVAGFHVQGDGFVI